MTARRSTMPAPPPNGVSSTWPPVSGVWRRGSSVRISWPCSSALRTWRCERNQSNHSGKSVTTSSCIVSGPLALVQSEEARVDLDAPGRRVHRRDRVLHQRHELTALELEEVARRVREQARHAAQLAAVGHDGASHQVVGPVLVLLERG